MINLRIGTVCRYLSLHKAESLSGPSDSCACRMHFEVGAHCAVIKKKRPGRRKEGTFVCTTLKGDGGNGDERN